MKNNYPNHINEIGKINRAVGQLEGIRKMIEDNRYCVEIMQQLKAVRSAIKTIEQNVLKKHMQMCLLNAAKNKNEEEILIKIDELQKIIKNYN
jgi:CsoR family transcriptional regulator, copper-sensing transcriptional repressor